MGLAYQKGNQVTLSYRQQEFSRLKERNALRIREAMKARKLRVLFGSQPVEVRETSVLIDVAGSVTEIPNDWVWVFAGGEPPSAFLQKVGVAMGERDMTREAGAEAQLVMAARP
jgi:thioredoxin reductase